MSPGEAMELPIFELPLAILPRERSGLHVFEERYKRMINRSIEEDLALGILLRDDDGPREIGCTAMVDEVLERYEDGRLDIVAVGVAPFRVIERFESAEYPAARAVEITDPGEPRGDHGAALAAREAFLALAERSPAGVPPEEEIAAEDAYGIAGRVELPSATKQRLLELRDEDERMELVARALEVAAEALDDAEERAAKASSNGHRLDGGKPG